MGAVVGLQHAAVHKKQTGHNDRCRKNGLAAKPGYPQTVTKRGRQTLESDTDPDGKGKKAGDIAVITLSGLRFSLVQVDHQRKTGRKKQYRHNKRHLPVSPEMGCRPGNSGKKWNTPQHRPIDNRPLHVG